MAQVTPRVSIPYPDLTDVPNAQTAFQNMLTQIDSRMMSRHATVGAIPSGGSLGQLAYITDADAVYMSNSSGLFARLSRSEYFVKPSDTARTLTTTNTADPYFSIPLLASSTYQLDCHYFIYSDSGVDFKAQWTLPAGATGALHSFAPDLGATNLNSYNEQFVVNNAAAGVIWGIVSQTGNPQYVKQMVTITTTTAGSAVFTWSQNVSSALATTLAQDSFIKVTRL